MNQKSIIAQPYAEALVELASSVGEIADITEDLLDIAQLLGASESLRLFLINPIISKKSKKAVLYQLLDTQVHRLLTTFLYILIDKQRIALFDSIVKRYLMMSNELEDTIIVHLKTAQLLTTEQYNLLENTVQKMTKTQTVKIKTQVDSNLIAGLILQIGSKVIDTSLLGQLQKMASHLNAAPSSI